MVVLTPFLRNCGYGFTWKSGTILTWGGMRGAIALALALMSRDLGPSIMLNKLLIQVAGVITMTLIFNATTIHWLLKFLGIGQITDKNMESMARTVALLQDIVQATEKVTRMDDFLAGADWAWVHKVTRIKNPYVKKANAFSSMMKHAVETFRGHCTKCEAEITIEPSPPERERMESESRLLVLRALRTSLSNQHESYGILKRSLGHLNTSIENAMHSPDKVLEAEDVRKAFLTIGFYVKFLKKYMINLTYKPEKDEELLTKKGNNGSAFCKACIKVYLSQTFASVMSLVSFISIVPIVGEYLFLFTVYSSASERYLRTEILVFEVINCVLTLFFVFEAVITIWSLGCGLYLKTVCNMLNLIVTVTAVAQMIYVIILIATSWYSHTRGHLYALITLTSMRIIRLLTIVFREFYRNILNQICSEFYNAFDLAVGFVVANDEVTKSAYKIIEYEECASDVRYTAENNIYKMLCYIDQIEVEHPEVACAWRSHRAAIYILRNMKEFIEEMVNVYMIDETDAEHLLGEIEMKMDKTFSQPRYMKTEDEIQTTLSCVLWIKNDEMLEEIKKNYEMKSYVKNDVIQEAGEMHTMLQILHKGIIKVSGTNTGEKQNILPNTDTANYFYSKGSFVTYMDSPHTLGLLGYLLQTPSVTTADSQDDPAELISISFETISQIEQQFGSLSFFMWKPVAMEIAFAVLREEQTYENWSDERLKIHLEEGMFPNLEKTDVYDVHTTIDDMVLIQGRLRSKISDTIYVGPAYIPNTVRSFQVLDDIESRPRVVMVLFREMKCHACSAMGWLERDEIISIGVCFLHGMKRMSVYNKMQMKENFGQQKSIIHTLGQHLKPKSERILESESL